MEDMELSEFKLYDKSNSIRWKLLMFYGECVHCKLKITRVKRFPHQGFVPYTINNSGEVVTFSIDHIIPTSRGGKNHVTNYQCLCVPCNKSKGNDPESDHYIMTPEDIPADFFYQIHSRVKRDISENYPEWKPYYGF